MPKRPVSGEPAYCSICRKRVLVERPKTGNEGYCPGCGGVIWLTNDKPDTDLIILVEGKVVEPLKFNAAGWATASMRVRGGMAADLISTRRLMPLTKTEVIALLGNPGGVYPDGFWYGVDLGRREEFRGVAYRLRIKFDSQGKTKLVELEQHRLRKTP